MYYNYHKSIIIIFVVDCDTFSALLKCYFINLLSEVSVKYFSFNTQCALVRILIQKNMGVIRAS